MHAFRNSPFGHRTFSGDPFSHRVHYRSSSQMEQGLQQSAQQRIHLTKIDIQEVGKNTIGNNALNARLKSRGAKYETSHH